MSTFGVHLVVLLLLRNNKTLWLRIGGGYFLKGDRKEMKADIMKLELLAWDIIITEVQDSYQKNGKIGSASMVSAVQILQVIYSETKFNQLLKDIRDIGEYVDKKYQKRMETFHEAQWCVNSMIQDLSRDYILGKINIEEENPE